MELPEFDTVLPRRRANMHNTAATTHNIKTRPAIDIAMAKLFCDMHSASSGLCNKQMIYIELHVISKMIWIWNGMAIENEK